MPRLIDADKARKEATIDLVVHLLDRQPTIDAVPVIRCKNCQHFAEFRAEAKKDGADGTCRRLLMKVVENDFSSVRAADFCSYGERKE